MRLLILAFAFFAHAEIIDRIVAIVNKEPILSSQVKPGHDIETLIDDAVIAQEIRKLGLDPSESEIDSAISNIMTQNKMTPTTFEAALKENNGMNMPEYREFLRKQFFKRNLIQNKVKNRISAKTGSEVRVQAEQAVFKTEPEALQASKDPHTVFQSLGTISKEDLVPAFAKTVFSLKEGETSKPLKSPQGFILIKVKKRFEIPLEKVDKQRYDQELETAFKRYVKELRASAYIERK
ncbi:MAG: SurA N-terminal domain-containing protein [Myxococcaceae bacterium]